MTAVEELLRLAANNPGYSLGSLARIVGFSDEVLVQAIALKNHAWVMQLEDPDPYGDQRMDPYSAACLEAAQLVAEGKWTIGS